jgi:hypothetical protein
MSRNTQVERPWWLLPLITFLVGLLIGWWGIGWGIWPVEYTNSLPQDLRAAERDSYLTMVAESFGRDGDSRLAQERLNTWSRDQLRDDLQRLQARLMNEDVLRASQVQQLAGVLGVYAPRGGYVPDPTPTIQPTEPDDGGGGALAPGSLLRTICTAVLWAGLALAGIVGAIYLWNWWRRSQLAGSEAPDIDDQEPFDPDQRFSRSAQRVSGTVVRDDNKDEWSEQAWESTGEPEAILEPVPPWETEPAPPTSTRSEVETPPGFMSRPAEEGRHSPQVIKSEPPRPPQSEPSSAPVQSTQPPVAVQPQSQSKPERADRGKLGKVSEFRGMYQMGESDYDEAFDITDAEGGYIGQCGLALADPVGRSKDQAAALQVWLWDTNDPDTKVQVLMSEGAYRDTALRDQLSGDHPAIPVRPGSEFELETHNLMLRGQVERLDYGTEEPAHGIFSEILIHLDVFSKTR